MRTKKPPVPLRTTDAYIGNTFTSKPPFFMTIATCGQKILVVTKSAPSSSQPATREITLPSRDMLYIKGNVLDSEYMPEPTNRANFAEATVNVLSEALGKRVSPLETLFLAQDRYGLIRQDQQTILSVAKLLPSSHGNPPHIFLPTQEEIEKKKLSPEHIHELSETRKATAWVDFISFFNELARRKTNGNPLLQKDELYPFEAQVAFKGRTEILPVSTGTVLALQSYAEKHMKNTPTIEPFRHISKEQIKKACCLANSK